MIIIFQLYLSIELEFYILLFFFFIFKGEEYVMDQPAMIAAYQQYHQAQTHAQPNSEKQQYQDSFDTSAEIQGIDWGTTTSAEDNNKKSKQPAAADPASGLFNIGGMVFFHP